jgi:hypothetical protein
VGRTGLGLCACRFIGRTLIKWIAFLIDTSLAFLVTIPLRRLALTKRPARSQSPVRLKAPGR